MEKLEEFLNEIAILEPSGTNDKRVQIEDSISFMQMVIDLEEHYEVEMPDELLTEELFESVNHLYEIISQLLEEKR